MRKIFSLAAALVMATGLWAQAPQALKKTLELKMPKTADDDMPGTRGASVVWHPVQKKYYASFAGNIGYPMGVFDATGKRLSDDELTTMADTRGLWYSPAAKKISGNSYSEGGWFSYALDAKGIPSEVETDHEGMNQPDAQCAGIMNTLTNQVLFLYGSQVYIYNKDAEAVDTVMIHWGREKSQGPADDEDPEYANEDYNSTSMIFTGVKGQEIGLLNITNKQIELYDIKSGYRTKVLTLPETAVVEPVFNFAYANGIYWLFNIEMRKWVGYK